MPDLRTVKDKDPEELKKLVKDIIRNKVFLAHHLPAHDTDLIKMVFLPVALGALVDVDPSSVGTLYEYFDAAGPRAVNGYPTFFSVRVLSKNDWAQILPVIIEQENRIENLELPEKERGSDEDGD